MGPIDYRAMTQSLLQPVVLDPMHNRNVVNRLTGLEGARPRQGGGGPLYKGRLTTDQARSARDMNLQQLRNIEKTVSDPIEFRRNPDMVRHLLGQVGSLRSEIKALNDFLGEP